MSDLVTSFLFGWLYLNMLFFSSGDRFNWGLSYMRKELTDRLEPIVFEAWRSSTSRVSLRIGFFLPEVDLLVGVGLPP